MKKKQRLKNMKSSIQIRIEFIIQAHKYWKNKKISDQIFEFHLRSNLSIIEKELNNVDI